MKDNAEIQAFDALELMLRWNRYCDTHDMEGDCILLNEERTYTEAFDDEQQAMSEILNSSELKRNDGFLVPIYEEDGRYKGMFYVPMERIDKFINISLISM